MESCSFFFVCDCVCVFPIFQCLKMFKVNVYFVNFYFVSQPDHVFTCRHPKVVNIVQSGLYLRVRWRLIMIPKDVLSGAQNAVQAAKGAFGDLQKTVPAVTTALQTKCFFLFS